jgi:hypothetical protein
MINIFLPKMLSLIPRSSHPIYAQKKKGGGVSPAALIVESVV